MACLGAFQQFTIIAVYLVVFWITLKLILVLMGQWLDAEFALAHVSTPWGLAAPDRRPGVSGLGGAQAPHPQSFFNSTHRPSSAIS
jgi:hypothetical protein